MSAVPLLAERAFWLAALATAAATALLVRLAPRLGWVDAAEGRAAARKHQPRPVPAVGGAALLTGLVVTGLVVNGLVVNGLQVTEPLVARPGSSSAAPFAARVWAGLPAPQAALAVVAAFAVGWLDDRRRGGLPPGAKLALQALAAAPLAAFVLALAAGTGAGAGACGAAAAGTLVAVAVALNAANTFDNADGALAGVGGLGLLGAGAPVAGALLGFLPFNLDASRRRGGTPSAYLGDAGSHLVGMLVVLHPLAWPALLVPCLDLARLALARWRAGSRPWIGDRRHLAHRMAARGLSPRLVAGGLALLAAPGCIAVAWSGGAPLASVLGLTLTVLLYLASLRGFPQVEGAGGARGAPGRTPPLYPPAPSR